MIGLIVMGMQKIQFAPPDRLLTKWFPVMESVLINTFPTPMLLGINTATMKTAHMMKDGTGVGTFACQRNPPVLAGIQLLDSIPKHLVMEYVLIRH